MVTRAIERDHGCDREQGRDHAPKRQLATYPAAIDDHV
jgi:hypothetical protein